MQEKKDRVIAIRKAAKLNQTDFGATIGLGQHAISHIENGNNKLSSRNAELICQKFNVNPQWLETGEGEMYNPPPKAKNDFLDLLAKEKGLNDAEKELIGSIIDLPSEARKAVIKWAIDLTERMESLAEAEREKTETPEARRIRELEESIRELEEIVAKQQKELVSLKGGASPYEEGTQRGTG